MAYRERMLTLVKEPYSHGGTALGGKIKHATLEIKGKQVTTSQSNPWPYQKGSGGDVGSAFETQRQYVDIVSPCRASVDYRNSGYHTDSYRGPVYTQLPSSVLFDMNSRLNLTTALTLDGMGATAISRVLPTNPAVDAMTFAAEMAREGIPKAVGHTLLRDRKPSVKGSAEEHLNYQFGVAPVISDTMGLVDTISKSDKILRQYERDSGRGIRRQYRFPTIHSDSTSRIWLPTQAGTPVSTYSMIGLGQVTEHTTIKRDVWFSGCFTYYLNLGNSQASRLEYAAQQAKRLYGVRLTPDVLWNLAPWSWAADWVTNIGDVLQNLSAFSTDGLVMRYGYIMEHYTMQRSVTGTVWPKQQGYLTSNRTAEEYRIERKTRRKATPFGFGLDPGSFSTRQWSILAALGITRAMR